MSGLEGAQPENAARELEQARGWLKEAGAVLLGTGAGLSASGGLNYTDKAFFAAHFPEFTPRIQTLWEGVTRFWDLTPHNAAAYWGYWAQHINVIRYLHPVTPPYALLMQWLKGREFFLFNSNADGQWIKAGFPPERMFAPQGDYALFQCCVPCREEVFDNHAMVEAMLAGRTPELTVPDTLQPRCPHCGMPLVPNLRKDDTFVQEPHIRNYPAYQAFLRKHGDAGLVLLELGVGFNSPGLIRYPFEDFTARHENVRLIRVNLGQAQIPGKISDRAVGLDGDVHAVLRELLG